jgi:hypothetical protein
MRTTLLIAAAALAASVISSQASGVYSQNIVGYVNQPMVGGNGFNYITDPIGGTNAAEVAIPGLTVGDNLFIWTGNGYNIVSYYGVNWDGAGDNWADQNGDGIPSPILYPGQLFIYQNSGNAFTNTFVGSCVLTNSLTLVGGNGFNYIASAPPVADTLDGTNLNLTLTVGDNAFLWTGNGYNIVSYYGVNWDGAGHNWADQNGDGIPSPVLPVGSGFIYQNSGSTYNWIQNFQVQ